MTKATIIIIIILAILLLSTGIYILNDKVIRPYYQNQGASSIIISINSDGIIPVINNNTIQWIPIQKICGGGE